MVPFIMLRRLLWVAPENEGWLPGEPNFVIRGLELSVPTFPHTLPLPLFHLAVLSSILS